VARTVHILRILRALRAASPNDQESVRRLMQVLHIQERATANHGQVPADGFEGGPQPGDAVVRHALALVDYRIHAMRRLHVLAAIVGASVIVLLPINDFDEIAILGLARAPGAAAHWAAWLFVGRFGMLLCASATVYGMSMWLEARRHRRAMAWSGACLALPPRGNASAR
jgi:hypothetical protein